jgi:hypothetical protein
MIVGGRLVRKEVCAKGSMDLFIDVSEGECKLRVVVSCLVVGGNERG